MPQFDFDIDGNADGATVLVELMQGLVAAGSANSGTTFPSETYPGMPFFNDSTGDFYVRNRDNSRWAFLFNTEGKTPGQLPIGSIYSNAYTAENPSTLLGYGQWARFGNGRSLIGLDETNPAFDFIRKEYGSYGHQLSEAQMPRHTHSATQDPHQHTHTDYTVTAQDRGGPGGRNNDGIEFTRLTDFQRPNITVNPTGGSEGFNITHPVIAIYRWQRVS